MNDPIVKILPANGSLCGREVRLDQAGKPIICHRHAWVLMNQNEKWFPLCRQHAQETMQAIENRM